MPSADVLTTVRASLETIAESFDEAAFTLPRPGREADEASRRAVIDTIRKYLLHRLREPDAPIVAVLVGLSGVGKSTILNSLAQDTVSTPGVVRPTTTNGILWAHRDHAARYWTEFVGRVRDQIGPATDVVIGSDPLTRHLTFVDTPPLELTPDDSAATALETLMFSDLCVFVTSSERYADVAPFEFLNVAQERGIPVLFVLNRLPDDPRWRRELLVDFAQKLVDAGFLRDPDPDFIFAVEESALRWHGGLAPEAVASLRKELSEVSDPEFRVVVIDETAEATLRAVAERAASLAAGLLEDDAQRRHLRSIAEETYARAAAGVSERLAHGEFASFSGHEVWTQAAIDLAGLVTRAAGAAAGETATDWLSSPQMTGLLDPGHEGLRRHSPQALEIARSELDEWKRSLADVVAQHRKRRPRKRKMRRLTDDLWRAALDPGFESRALNKVGPAAVERARALLADAIERGILSDGERFRRRLGDDQAQDLADRIRRASDYLMDLPEAEGVGARSEAAARGG